MATITLTTTAIKPADKQSREDLADHARGARPVQDVRRLRLQPAHHDPDPGGPNARCVAGDDRQGVLRRARRGAAVRGTALARLARARGQTRRVDGVVVDGHRTARTRRRPPTGAVTARATARPVHAD